MVSETDDKFDVVKSYKYRIYPTHKQVGVLNKTMLACQQLYNAALEQRIYAHRTLRVSISKKMQRQELPKLKEVFPEYYDVHSQVLQNVMDRVDGAFSGFFKRVKLNSKAPGFPRFKNGSRYNSICFPQKGFEIKGARVCLSKIGLIKCVFHRKIPIESKIKTCIVKREQDRWYVIFAIDIISNKPKKRISNSIGIDLGLTNFAVLSNGVEIKNPKHFKKSEVKLKKLHQEYSQKRNVRSITKLAALHRKIANQRRDFQHKISRHLVTSFDLISFEDLQVKKMISDNKYHLQKHISDAAWGTFISMIKYKAEEAGTYYIAINPKGTTQKCSGCGTVIHKCLNQRWHSCSICGLETTRDKNAAININKLGINLVGSKFLNASIRIPANATG